MSEQQKYEVGGKIKISDEWWKIGHINDNGYAVIHAGPGAGIPVLPLFVQDYRPPEKREWFTKEDWKMTWGIRSSGARVYEAISQVLQEKYGDPPKEVNK